MNVEKVVSYAAGFLAFLIHKVVFLVLFMHYLILLSYL